MTGLIEVDRRFWRMLSINWQRDPLSGAGAALTGGRWNRPGQRALYLSVDHSTAIAEFHQDVVAPGTLAAFDIRSSAIADLTDSSILDALGIDADHLLVRWKRIVQIERVDPPGWLIAETLVTAGAHGALVPSAQFSSGVNLVLWRWSAEGGDGARVRVIDPRGDLG